MSSSFTVSPLIDIHGSFERTKISCSGGTVLGSSSDPALDDHVVRAAQVQPGEPLRHNGIAMPANGGTGLDVTL
jgi:hypothetical protein